MLGLGLEGWQASDGGPGGVARFARTEAGSGGRRAQTARGGSGARTGIKEMLSCPRKQQYVRLPIFFCHKG